MRERKEIQTLPRTIIRLAALFGSVLLAALTAGGCARPPGKGAPSPPAAARPARKAAVFRPYIIAGMVLDAGGLPVAGVPTLVLSSKRPVPLDPRLDNRALKVVASDRTGQDGLYRLRFDADPKGRRFYLSFYVLGQFDEVRFARPDRIDITGLMARRSAILHDVRLAIHGKWAEVQETIKGLPKDSAKARIIRRYGSAEEIHKKPGKSGEETWWYYAHGRSFTLREGKILKETKFAPVLK